MRLRQAAREEDNAGEKSNPGQSKRQKKICACEKTFTEGDRHGARVGTA